MKKTKLILLILCLCLVAPGVSYMNTERVVAAEEETGESGDILGGLGSIGDALRDFLKSFWMDSAIIQQLFLTGFLTRNSSF